MQVSFTPLVRRNSLFVLPVLSLFTLLATGGLKSAHGSAQTSEPEPDQTSVEAHRSTTESSTGLEDLFQFLDRDGDGRVDRYEGAEAFLFLTAEADADGDKALSQKELVDFLERESAEEQAEQREVFQDLDRNGDGMLTSEELPDGLSGVLPEADLDKDGTLTFEELSEFDGLDDPGFEFEQELRGFLEEVDEDGDGFFALVDLPPPARAEFAKQFNELDTDKDGLVSEAELLFLLEEELRGAVFEVHGSDALMSGVIGPNTPGRVLELVVEHPEVRRIVMHDVPGSMDDDSNLRAARLVRQRGFATHVPADGEVASGGTDLFQAGIVRTKDNGARFGVHSWSGFGVDGADVPEDDPQHAMYLEYYREMGIPDAFYWYTLEAAPADDIHWMTEEELKRFSMLTDP